MRIFIIPPNDLLRHPIPNRMYHIAKRLANNHEIFILSYTNHPLAHEIKRSLKAVEIPISNALKTNNLGLYYIINASQIYTTIKNVIQKEDIDVIIHGNILPSFIASKLAKKMRIPNIYDFLDYFPESASAYYTKGRGLIEMGVKTFVYPALRNSDVIVTPSYGLKKIVENISPGISVHVIPNGVDAEIFKPIDQKIARKEIGLDTDYHLLLLQGSLDVWIDVESIMRVLRKLRKIADIRLLIVGFSHAKYYYKLLTVHAKHFGIDKYIYTYPPQPYEKMPLFINSSDIVIAPVRKMLKNFATPLKIAEAISCGKPVITRDIADFKIWYKMGVYTYSSYAELEDLIRDLFNMLDEIKNSLHIYSFNFRKTFDWNNLSTKYIVLLENFFETSSRLCDKLRESDQSHC
jgi:glycosyltransferase involved in cell wall biosynthesis